MRGSGTTAGSRRPIYQEFLTGERKLACAPWGSITRNPYGWKGPCYLLTDGIFPTYDALLEGIEWEEYGPGNDPRCEHCAIHSGFEPSAAYVAAGSLQGERQEHGLDADGLTFACAMTVEERIARRLGRTALVGSRRVEAACPKGALVSFGIAGALSGELPVGTVIDATRVVDESGDGAVGG